MFTSPDQICTLINKKVAVVEGDVKVGAISMGLSDKNYGGGKIVVFQAQITATPDTITVTLDTPWCPIPPLPRQTAAGARHHVVVPVQQLDADRRG